MQKIYLERKPVLGTSYQHLYLVLREEPQTPEEFNSLSWRQSGNVIKGAAPALGVGGALRAETGLLANTLDRYESQSDITNRGIPVDLSGVLSPSNWTAMEEAALGLHQAAYRYEVPNVLLGQGPIANSNAIIFSTLNSVGIDVRQHLPVGVSFPGAVQQATLLGEGTYPNIIASSQLQDGLTILGRDNVNDYMVGTNFSDQFYGEQKASYHTTFDTVSYGDMTSPVAVFVGKGSNPLLPNLETTVSGGNGVDQLFGIERVILSSHADQAIIRHYGDSA